jgi:hypothetical protein
LVTQREIKGDEYMEFKLLSEELTLYYCKKILMPQGAAEILVDMSAKIRNDNKLYSIYEDFYTKYIDSGYWTTVWEPLNIHPYVEEVFGNHASLFYLHSALERLPLTEKRYSELGIDEEIFVKTLSDISVWVQNAYNLVGYYCIRNFSWIWRHLEARLFRLGRLQYLAKPFGNDIKGFYNSKDNIFLLLCSSGIELRANGDMQGVCGKEKTEDGFITQYNETEEFYIGNPITPYGKGLRETIMLKKSEWQKVLDKDTCMLEIHIPRDGNFEPETIKESYKQAREFYRRHFPELDINGMMCHTWLFTPQLQEMLPHTSNIVKFQRQFYFYPTKGSVGFLWNFVFNEFTEVKDAKPDTYLRSRVLDFVKEGREIFDMSGVFLDIGGEYGQVSYMDKFDLGKYTFLG